MIKRAFLLTALLASPAVADDDEDRLREGLDLFGEATGLIFEGLRDEIEPMLDEIGPMLQEDMIPFLQGLGTMIEDLSAYELPERLPNGDIIIRRRPDAPEWQGSDGEIEL